MINPRTISRPLIVAAVFLALHVLPLFWQPNPLWGVDFLYYLPAPVQGAFILLSVSLFIPGFRRQVRTVTSTLPFSPWGRNHRKWVARSLVVLAALAAFILFSSARHFLGDGYLLLAKFAADSWGDFFRAPLSFTIIGALHDAGVSFWETSENTYRFYSYTSGVLYVLLGLALAGTLGHDKLEKSIVLAFLLTTGFMQLFFGYVENYALYMPCLLLYLYLGIRTLEYRIPLFVPALVMGVMLALHPALAVFAPSLLFLAYRTYRHRKSSATPWKNLANTLAALCCVPATTALFLVLSGVEFRAFLLSMSGGDVLPVFAEPGFYAQYRLFSLAHVLDFLNQQLLAAPAAFMVLFLCRKRDLGRHAFLVLCAIVPLFFTLIAKANIGAFRDWDVLSLPALPFTVLMAAAFLERVRNREQRFHSAFLVCGAAALHTVLWIGLNASAGPAEARFASQLGRLTGHASASGWVAMAKFYHGQQNLPAALVAYKRALDADPSNPNRSLAYGAALSEMGRHTSAVENFKKAIALRPDHAVPYMNLGAAFSDLGQFEEAIEYTRKAIALQPDNATAHANLGAIYGKAGQVAKSIEHLERAAALRPDHADTYGNLGAMYREAGKYTRAIAALKKAVTIRPEDATDCLNLGVVYYDVGQFDNAIKYLGKALEINPRYVLAYTNIGNAYKRQGKYPFAIEYYEKALEIQTGRSQFQTFMAIGHTYFKMGEHEKAIPHFRKAVGLNPNHANAHLLLGLTYQKLNRGDRAKVHFEKTLEIEPEHPQADQIKLWIKGVGEGRI